MTSKTRTKSAKQTVFGSKCFNARLFFEGVKRLRVIALAVAILALTAAILVPVISWIGYAEQYEASCWEETPFYDDEGNLVEWRREYVPKPIQPQPVNNYLLCLPLYILPFAAPLFFFILFSFLHKRKQSDFFHAIPYTRTCVFVSFTTAALAFVTAIATVSALLSGLIYAACPFTSFAFWDLAGLVGLSVLAAAFLSSFMMLSLSLTGTGATTLLLFALFASITRIVLGLFYLTVDDFLIVNANYYPFLSPYWYLPFRMFVQSGDYYDEAIPPYSQLIPYTVIVTLAVFALAGLFYKLRRSEMAERSAPSRRVQSIFRSLFTLPFALLLTVMIVLDEIDFEVALILFVITVVAFYLYELITTKRVRNLWRATPWLGAVAGGCVVFVISFALFGACVHADIPEEKIRSVSVEMGASNSFESLNTREIETDDERMIALVAEALDYTRAYSQSSIFPDGGFQRISYHTVTIRKTNGMTVKRNLAFTHENEQKLESYLIESEEYTEKYLELPTAETVTYLYAYTQGSSGYYDVALNNEEYEAFWSVLREEYASLSLTDKMIFKDGYDYAYSKDEDAGVEYGDYVYVEQYSPFYITLSVSGMFEGERYHSSYTLPAAMDETISYLLNDSSERRTHRYASDYLYETYGVKEISTDSGVTPLKVAKAIYRDLATGDVDYTEGELRLASYMDYEYSIAVSKNEADYIAHFEKISEYLETHTEPQSGTVLVLVTADLWSNDLYAEAYSTVMLYLTEEEYKALLTSAFIDAKE